MKIKIENKKYKFKKVVRGSSQFVLSIKKKDIDYFDNWMNKPRFYHQKSEYAKDIKLKQGTLIGCFPIEIDWRKKTVTINYDWCDTNLEKLNV